ncbi:substrate-binding domain-containing protein [Glaciihabitans sp. UYNi722]|uniref:sugar ABC transporter substrate-binding protein n=1 Tax=Glaciihabitans sp. UYNi722 TaxID=3156344 RepID=UPI00339370ED
MVDTVVTRLGSTIATSAIVSVFIVGVLAGCSSPAPTSSSGSGSGSGSGSAGVAAAAAALKPYLTTKVPKPVGQPFNATAASGKVVEVIDLSGANPAVAAVSQSARTALTHVGAVVQRCDASGVAVNVAGCINQGISQSVKAIIVIGGDPKVYSQGIDAAKAKNIPVISALDFPTQTEVKASGVDASPLDADTALVSGNAAPPDALSGTLAADFIASDSKGKAKVLFISSPGIVGSDYVDKAFRVELKKRCPDCSIVSAGVAITSWASDLGAVVSSKLAQNPDINYVVPVFDPMAAYTNPAISQAGKSSSVKVVTVNGSLQQMQALSRGELIAAEIGQNLPEMGLNAADQALRYVVGAPVVKEATPAIRVFTSKNIGSITVAAENYATGEWYTGSPDALTKTYYAHWGK